MKKFIVFCILFILSFILFIDIVFSACSRTTPCCCEDRCWIEGVCCKKGLPNEYWHDTGCYDFEVWVEPNRMRFMIGKNTPINLYIKNIEEYTDRYDVTYEIKDTANPALIEVDIIGITPTDYVGPETKKLQPRITVLSSKATGKVFFNLTSYGDPSVVRNASLIIISSEFPISLIEFNYSWFLVLIILAGMLYLFWLKNYHS